MFRRFAKVRIITLVVLVLLAGVAPFVGASLMAPTPVSAQVNPAHALAPNAPVEIVCNITELAVFEDRIHVSCFPGYTTPNGVISFFAYSTVGPDMARANQFLTLANTAYALGKTINITFDDNPAVNPPNCRTIDCRKIIEESLTP